MIKYKLLKAIGYTLLGFLGVGIFIIVSVFLADHLTIRGFLFLMLGVGFVAIAWAVYQYLTDIENRRKP